VGSQKQPTRVFGEKAGKPIKKIKGDGGPPERRNAKGGRPPPAKSEKLR